jgi:hypothetical protein
MKKYLTQVGGHNASLDYRCGNCGDILWNKLHYFVSDHGRYCKPECVAEGQRKKNDQARTDRFGDFVGGLFNFCVGLVGTRGFDPSPYPATVRFSGTIQVCTTSNNRRTVVARKLRSWLGLLRMRPS